MPLISYYFILVVRTPTPTVNPSQPLTMRQVTVTNIDNSAYSVVLDPYFCENQFNLFGITTESRSPMPCKSTYASHFLRCGHGIGKMVDREESVPVVSIFIKVQCYKRMGKSVYHLTAKSIPILKLSSKTNFSESSDLGFFL